MFRRKWLLILLLALVSLFVQSPAAALADRVDTVSNTSSVAQPVLDGPTGQPIFFGKDPWMIQPGETIFSHDWLGAPRFNFKGVNYNYIGSVGISPFHFFLVPDKGFALVGNQELNQAPVSRTSVTNDSGQSQQVLDGVTGQPVYIGNKLWTIAPDETIFSHPYDNPVDPSHFIYNGITYHYIGSVGGSKFRFFLVRDWSTPTPNGMVDRWLGVINKLPSGTNLGDYFQHDNGHRYGIKSDDPGIEALIKQYQLTGARVRISGHLLNNVPGVINQRLIMVDQIEAISGPATQPRDLSPFADVGASSTLPPTGGDDHASSTAIDGLIETAWCEWFRGEGNPDGIGQYIQLSFAENIQVAKISMDIGFDKSEDTFYANNRIRKATLVFSSGETKQLNFSDIRGMQTIDMGNWSPTGGTKSVKIVIDDVYHGSQTTNTCISEIQVWGRVTG